VTSKRLLQALVVSVHRLNGPQLAGDASSYRIYKSVGYSQVHTLVSRLSLNDKQSHLKCESLCTGLLQSPCRTVYSSVRLVK